MSTEKMIAAMQDHPAGSALSLKTDEQSASAEQNPQRAFRDALKELEETVLAHGKGSVEADRARERVSSARQAVAAAMREQTAA